MVVETRRFPTHHASADYAAGLTTDNTDNHGCAFGNANGVELQSPVSRSPRWVTDHPHHRTPTGFHKRRQGRQFAVESGEK